MSTRTDLNKVIRVIHKVIPALREEMTSITRYIKDTREKYPNFTEGQWLDRHIENRKLAVKASDNIIRLLNCNPELAEVEKMKEQEEKHLSLEDIAILDAMVTAFLENK